MAEESWWADMFAPLIEVGQWIRALIPKRFQFKMPRMNFITVHYLYITGCTIAFSIILYGYGNMAYIDALFFAGGTATQSGLNTIDVNLLKTYQQVLFACGSSICTPIWINTVVVFIRLYWFEKRFEHIVKESRLQRRTRTLSRSKSQMRGDLSTIEKGVQGRKIKVLPETMKENGMTSDTREVAEARREFREKHGLSPATVVEDAALSSSASDDSTRDPADEVVSEETEIAAAKQPLKVETNFQKPSEPPSGAEQPISYTDLTPRHNRGITFADEVSNDGRHSPELARVPEQRDLSKHIEFLKRQQANAKQGGAYYIPGPRDFDEGKVPEQIEQYDAMRHQITRTSFSSRPTSVRTKSIDAIDARSVDARNDNDLGDKQFKRGITIDEPEHPGHRGRAEDAETSSRRGRSHGAPVRRRSFGSHTLGDAGRGFTRTWTNLTRNRTEPKEVDPMPYFTWQATTGRNSTFLGLSQEQREELGGIEYRSLKTLCGILLCYFFGFHLAGIVIFAPWIERTQPWKGIVQQQGQNPAWWGIFTPISMFNDLGFTLTNNSMYSFANNALVLLVGSFFIIIGNTGFPIMLRFIIWVMSKIASRGSPLWEELRFLLDHPRRCFTLLFPSKATWWLFWVLVGLNGIDLVFFIVLDLGPGEVTAFPVGYRILNGWFQAVSTRTAGFSSVNLADLHAAIQVSYMIMMYISVFPIAISVRRTNVYEEKSLGLFGGEEDEGDSDQSYVGQHLRRQLSFDLWYIFLGLFIIAIVEGDRIANTNLYAFTTFSVLFEIVSAYGTVGLSLGYPTINASFSAEFRPISKLIIIAMMIRGRHRGLPYALDRAILLPSEKLHQSEVDDAQRRAQRRGSAFAEGANDFTRSKTWEEGELDESGLPMQHTGISASIDPMTAGAGGADPESLRQLNSQRSATLSANSTRRVKTQTRSRSLSRLVASGLSAGPTSRKHS